MYIVKAGGAGLHSLEDLQMRSRRGGTETERYIDEEAKGRKLKDVKKG